MPSVPGSAVTFWTSRLSFSPASTNAPSSRTLVQMSLCLSSSDFLERLHRRIGVAALVEIELGKAVARAGRRRRAEDADLDRRKRRIDVLPGLRRVRRPCRTGWRRAPCRCRPGSGSAAARPWLRMKVRPSMPTGTSMTFLTPAAAQASYSLFLICREAFSMSGKFAPTPPQNSFMPAPVPVDSTTTLTFGLSRWNCSATAVVKG